ncbi:DeoR/GlpR family DNA-binding transcription regulator [Propionibacteriaceae bacterium G1746]|uniref:DeoR/GlpR family DNA-binding transcription regulator n=1 Tax=Aestuariimicrobium sp. G57 TaxID=3418485 RepID=UPI003C169653
MAQPGTPTTKQERQDRLATLIFSRGTMRVEELQDEMGVSAMTLYRDLAELESRQVIIRARGEVSAAASSLSETSFVFRLGQEASSKHALVPLAAPLVERGDSVLVDDSTTAHFILESVLDKGSLTVVTNCTGQADLVVQHSDAELIMVGGRYRRALQAFYGPSAMAALGGLRVDVAFLGAAAIQDGMVYHPYEDVAAFKRFAATRATTSVLVVSASKFDRTALYEVGRLVDFDVIITDMDPHEPQLKAAAEAGVRVISSH